MRILLTNDDGIHAPGLQSLERVMERHGELVIVAPEGPVSGCSHLTTTNRHLTAPTAGVRHYSIDGTPADCVRLGLVSVHDLCADV